MIVYLPFRYDVPTILFFVLLHIQQYLLLFTNYFISLIFLILHPFLRRIIPLDIISAM